MGLERKWFPENANRDEMVALQQRLAERATWEGIPPRNRVAGVDQAYDGDAVVSAAVVVEDSEVVDSAVVSSDAELPYVPGLLAFREGPAAAAAVRSLDITPDVVLVDGSGRIHPRQAGLATHLGVALGLPAVGVAKSLLCGEPRREVDRLEEGETVEVRAGDEVEAHDDAVVGHAYQSRQYSVDALTTVNPLYVSSGHLVDGAESVDVVADNCHGYKLPEPVRLADDLADRRR